MSRLRSSVEFFKKLQIEPLLLLFSITVTTYNSGAGFLAGQKVCFPDGPPGVEVVCNDTNALRESADLNQMKTILRECLPGIAVILAGSWRDATHLSLPLILIAHVGELFSTFVDFVSSVVWSMSPWLTAALDSFFGGLGGSRSMVTMASLAYLVEKTTPEERNSRIPLLMFAILGGMCISMTVSGWLLTNLNYSYFFLLILALYSINILMSFLLIKEKRNEGSKGAGYFASVKRLKIIFKPRPNNIPIWLFIISSGIVSSMYGAESAVSYLFLQAKFKYTPKSASFFNGYRMFMAVITTTIAIPFFKKILKLSDFKIALISAVPSIVSCFGLAFAETESQLYFFATLDLLRIVFIATLWILLTACIESSEIGIYTSFLTFGEGILPIALNPLYALVFKQTVESMPGAFYFVSGGSLIISAALVWISSYYCELPQVNNEDDKTNDKEEILSA